MGSPAAQDQVQIIARLYLISCFSSSDMALAELESAIVSALDVAPELINNIRELPFSVLLRCIAGWTTHAKCVGKAARTTLERINEFAVYLTASKYEDIGELLITGSLRTRISITEFLGAVLRRAPSRLEILIEANTLSGEDLDLRVASASTLTRWGSRTGLSQIGDILSIPDLPTAVETKCRVCLRTSSNQLLRRCANDFVYKLGSRDIFIEELLSRDHIEWLAKIPRMIEGLLRALAYYRRVGSNMKLQRVLLRLVTSARPQFERILQTGSLDVRCEAKKILELGTRNKSIC